MLSPGKRIALGHSVSRLSVNPTKIGDQEGGFKCAAQVAEFGD
jgi:hypothetical protein